METNLAYKQPSPGRMQARNVNTYLENQILNAKPEELILKVYDFILLNIRKKNYNKANAGFVELIASLNFDYKDVSLGFFKLYTYCQELIRKEKWEEALGIVKDLRDTWAQAFRLN